MASPSLGPSWAGEGACTLKSTAEGLRTHCHPRGCCCLKRHPELTPLPRLHWLESLFPWHRLRGHRVTSPRPGLCYPTCPLQPRAPGVPGCRKATSQRQPTSPRAALPAPPSPQGHGSLPGKALWGPLGLGGVCESTAGGDRPRLSREILEPAVPHLAPSGAASVHRAPLAVAKVGQGVQPGQGAQLGTQWPR